MFPCDMRCQLWMMTCGRLWMMMVMATGQRWQLAAFSTYGFLLYLFLQQRHGGKVSCRLTIEWCPLSFGVVSVFSWTYLWDMLGYWPDQKETTDGLTVYIWYVNTGRGKSSTKKDGVFIIQTIPPSTFCWNFAQIWKDHGLWNVGLWCLTAT